MRKILFIVGLILVCGCIAVAQDYPKAELGAGWNLLHIDTGGAPGVDKTFPAGFFADGTYYFAKLIGVTGDFQINWHTFPVGQIAEPSVDAHALSFHAGPRVKFRMGKVEPFAHGLFGFTHVSGTGAGVNQSDTAFSLKLGGGLDVGVARHFALRLGEFNYYLTKFGVNSEVNFNGQGHQNNFTFSAGVVIR